MNTSVNVPTNPQRRDADVDNKLRLYGIFNGELIGSHCPHRGGACGYTCILTARFLCSIRQRKAPFE